jgi:hypothetical protein
MEASGFKIGIEIEVLLQPRLALRYNIPDLRTFVDMLVNTYNSAAPSLFPRMHSDLDGTFDGPEFVEWSVTDDVTLTDNPPFHCRSSLVLAKGPLYSCSTIQTNYCLQGLWKLFLRSCIFPKAATGAQ